MDSLTKIVINAAAILIGVTALWTCVSLLYREIISYFFRPTFKSNRSKIDRENLLNDGYILNERGVTTCSTCGNYCGQCSDASRHGLTLETYKERFWK